MNHLRHRQSDATLHHLIHETWETHETLVTDEVGKLSFTGFKGDYTLQAENGKAAFSLTRDLAKDLRLS